MTMAETAVEDAAPAPPGPAKPPPPSCTNNNTLAATANRNHRMPRKRKRLDQVVYILQAHQSSPSEGEVLRSDSNGPVSEEEEAFFGTPRSSSRSGVDIPSSLNALPLRLKEEESPVTPTATDGELENCTTASTATTTTTPTMTITSMTQSMTVGESEEDLRNNRHYHHHNHHHHRTRHNHRNLGHNQNKQSQKQSSSNRSTSGKQNNGPCTCVQCSPSPNNSSSIMLHSPTSPLTPMTPLTPLAPLSLPPLTPGSLSSYSFEQYMHTKYLPDMFRGRSHSDSDVVPGWEQRIPPASTSSSMFLNQNHLPRSGSLESETTSPQELPLDLSMKNLMTSAAAAAAAVAAAAAAVMGKRPPALQLLPAGIVTRGSVSVPVVRGDVASPTTKETVAERYNLAVRPVVEEMPPGADLAYVCPECGQMFSLHDRLAKHIASRHRRQGPQDASAKAYLCNICKKSFARSDMLTRHTRLHTGVKPYTCKVCKQVFSRSDHLSTHQRTHTGEKPYKCPDCTYAACRRDMITRHQKTHTKAIDTQGRTTGSPKMEPGSLKLEDDGLTSYGQVMPVSPSSTGAPIKTE